MYSNTSRNDFIDTFTAIGRADIGDGNGGDFTIDALHALFDYLEQWENDVGEPIEFDPIGLCCQFSEYASAPHAVNDINSAEYSDIKRDKDLDNVEAECLEWLQDRTIVVEFDGGIVINSEF